MFVQAEMNEALLSEVRKKAMAVRHEGRVANYIPELAKVSPDLFSLSCMDTNGVLWEKGETEHLFTMQSLSKIVALSLAIEKLGTDTVFKYVGMEPSADSFNSLMRLEMSSPKPSNPFMNAGAIAICSLLYNAYGEDAFDEICAFMEGMTGVYPSFSEEVFESESKTADRNRSLAYFMKSVGFLHGDVETFLNLYFKQCSITCRTRDLAKLALLLGTRGICCETGKNILQKETVYTLLGLMTTCGLYNGSGEFAVRVGVAGKSGVCGGILAVVPGRFGVGVFSPALDAMGNSVAGLRALELLSDTLDFRGLALRK
ncbi:glutaminase A [Synergistaceae bacterium OttesenSCG-928-D05]|nr:glutaminase A [Synergistaceae bacterium OttesenSCG-928-D05]